MGTLAPPLVQQTAPTSPVEATHVTPLQAREGTTRATPEERRHSSQHSRTSRAAHDVPPGWTLIPAWKGNYVHFNVWGEIIYLLPNFNGATVEV